MASVASIARIGDSFVVQPAAGLSPTALLPLLAGFVVLILAVLFLGRRRARKSQARGHSRDLDPIKEEVLWRAMARAGPVTVDDIVAQSALSADDVERAFMLLVAEGQAVVAPDASGTVTYRIEASSAEPNEVESGTGTDDTP